MGFNAHSLFVCGLLAHNYMPTLLFKAHFWLVMTSLIHFRVTPEKWLESAYNVLICSLYDGIRGQ